MEISYMTWLRNRIGVSKENVTLPPGVKTVLDLITWLTSSDPKYTALSEHKGVINVAINGTVINDWEKHVLNDSDQISFFSPLAGG